jgi:hypothetical protein
MGTTIVIVLLVCLVGLAVVVALARAGSGNRQFARSGRRRPYADGNRGGSADAVGGWSDCGGGFGGGGGGGGGGAAELAAPVPGRARPPAGRVS